MATSKQPVKKAAAAKAAVKKAAPERRKPVSNAQVLEALNEIRALAKETAREVHNENIGLTKQIGGGQPVQGFNGGQVTKLPDPNPVSTIFSKLNTLRNQQQALINITSTATGTLNRLVGDKMEVTWSAPILDPDNSIASLDSLIDANDRLIKELGDIVDRTANVA